MKFEEIRTLEDVRQFVAEHPTHVITAAWKDMLDQIDRGEETYPVSEFLIEADYQMFKYGGELEPDDLSA